MCAGSMHASTRSTTDSTPCPAGHGCRGSVEPVDCAAVRTPLLLPCCCRARCCLHCMRSSTHAGLIRCRRTCRRPLHFQHACLAGVFAVVLVAGLSPDQHIGSRLSVSALLLGPTWLAVLLSGVLVSWQQSRDSTTQHSTHSTHSMQRTTKCPSPQRPAAARCRSPSWRSSRASR